MMASNQEVDFETAGVLGVIVWALSLPGKLSIALEKNSVYNPQHS